jgi:hypothetical protein
MKSTVTTMMANSVITRWRRGSKAFLRCNVLQIILLFILYSMLFASKAGSEFSYDEMLILVKVQGTRYRLENPLVYAFYNG